MNDYLMAVIISFAVMFPVVVVLLFVVVHGLLDKIGFQRKEIRKLRDENLEMWHLLHKDYLPVIDVEVKEEEEPDIEDEM